MTHIYTLERRYPAIAAVGNNVNVVWASAHVGEILYRRSTDGGASFGNTMNLSNNNPDTNSYGPAIAAVGNNVYVVWADITPGNSEILYRRSTDGGASFGNTIKLSNNPGNSYGPAITAVGNNVYVVWVTSDYPLAGNSEIFYRRSTDGGASFGNIINLTGYHPRNEFFSFNPAIAVSNNLT